MTHCVYMNVAVYQFYLHGLGLWSRPALSRRLVKQRPEYTAAAVRPRSTEQSQHEELRWGPDQGHGGETLETPAGN